MAAPKVVEADGNVCLQNTAAALLLNVPSCDSSGYLNVDIKVGGGGGGGSNVTIVGGTANATPVPVLESAAVAVTGTFWQTTQPVSGTVAVTGTFWQATQPISGTVTANAGTGTYTVTTPAPCTASTCTSTVSLPYSNTAAATPTPVAGVANSGVDEYGADYAGGTSHNIQKIDANGSHFAQLVNSSGSAVTVATAGADALATSSNNISTGAKSYIFNGAGWDRGFYSNTAPVAINISTATTTQIVALSGSTQIRVINYSFTVAGTTPTVTFVYGTGTACGTGTTAISGAFAPLTGTLMTSPPGAAAFIVPAGKALCIVSGGTTPSIQGFLTYTQY